MSVEAQIRNYIIAFIQDYVFAPIIAIIVLFGLPIWVILTVVASLVDQLIDKVKPLLR